MTDIICAWLNNDLELSKFIDENNFASAFSNGYLIGEILNKYDLLNEFGKLSTKNTAEAKLNNFILLEPILKLLGVSFNKSIAKDLIDEKSSILINLLYQLFIALENKKRSNLTGLSMQTMQAPATTRLQELESTLYQQQLKKANPRQSDIELKEIIKRYQDYQQKMYERSQHDQLMSAEGRKQRAENHRQDRLERSKALRNEQMELANRIEAAVVKIPKPPASKTLEAILKKKTLAQRKEAESSLRQLDEFEERQMNIIGKEALADITVITRETSSLFSDEQVSSYAPGPSKNRETNASLQTINHGKTDRSNEYIGKIRAKLESDKDARTAREKRRRKVLVNCLKSHYEQEENDRENMVALRLMRQSQMERRIAVQLLQLRHEKDIIKMNRMERERQFQERREQEFVNALDKERELLKQLKQNNKDNLKSEQDLYNKKKAEIKMAKYKKHYNMTEKIIHDIIELCCKTSEYHDLTDGKIPPKIIRDWKLSFIHGVPIGDEKVEGDEFSKENYEKKSVEIEDISTQISRISTQSRDQNEYQRKLAILDEQDFVDYKQFIGEWEVQDETINAVDRNNIVLNWVVDHLYSLNNPVDDNAHISLLPPFPIKVAVVGKCFSGKSTLIQNLIKNNRCISVVPQEVINEALRAFDDNEEIEVPRPTVDLSDLSKDDGIVTDVTQNKTDDEKTENQVSDTNLNTIANDITASLNPDEGTEKVGDSDGIEGLDDVAAVNKEPSPRAIIGKSIKEELLSGRSISDALLVEAIVEYIGRIPPGTGWVIDDFPATYQQGKLFEKKVTGYDEKVVKTVDKKRQKTPVQAKECGIDALILLDTPDSACLSRAMTISERQIEGETNASGIGKDVIANLQTSMTNFAEHWPKLSKFYTRINENIIKTVNSSEGVSPMEIYLQVEMILDDIILSKQPPEEPVIIEQPPSDIESGKDQTVEIPVLEADIDAASKEVLTTIKSSRKRSKGSKSSKGSSRGSSAGSKSSDKKSQSRKSRSKSKSDSPKSKKEKNSLKTDEPVKSKKDSEKRKTSKGSKGSKSSSKGSRSSSSKGKKDKIQPEETKVAEIVVAEVRESRPGDPDWTYAEKPLDQEIVSIFFEFWDSINNVYTVSCKRAFREIRTDREEIIRYLHAVKGAFRQFLIRPDAKQDYIDQFQKDFNEMSEEWREDEEVQQDVHMRITELRDQLLEISQENQAMAEKEIEKVKQFGWIEDRVGMVSNQYINLMQSEFDHFQDVVRLLKDYYRSITNPVLDEFKPEFLRLPMIEIPTAKDETEENKDTIQNMDSSRPAVVNPTASPGAKKNSGKTTSKAQVQEVTTGDDLKELTDEDIDAMFKNRVPLIEIKCLTPQITPSILTSVPVPTKVIKGKDTGVAIVKLIQSGKLDKKGEKLPETIAPPSDPDARLLFDIASACYTIISGMLELETSQYGEKEDSTKAAPAGDKGKVDKKAKGGKKSRTPTPKKGGKEKNATATAKSRSRSGSAKQKVKEKESEESEEEKRNKLFIERAKNEYIAALQKEATITRTKLLQIMQKGSIVLKDLKAKVDSVFNELSVWIADKLLREDKSIKEIEYVFRYCVETKSPLKEKVEIIGDKFYLNPIDDDLDKPHSVSRPSPIEPLYENYFSIKQLKLLYSSFRVAVDSKSGSISIFDFTKLVNETLMAFNITKLPPFISKCSHVDVSLTAIADAFSCDKEYVNWRLFLLSCSEPWDWPSQADLLELLGQFKELDQQDSGFVTREQYQFINLWFAIPSTPSTPSNINDPKTVNRMSEIKKLFFEIFKRESDSQISDDPGAQQHVVEYLDYEDMLLHFAVFCTNNYYSGLLRALSIVVGQHVPHLSVIMKDITLSSDQEHENVPQGTADVIVSIRQLYKVLSFGHRKSENYSVDVDDVDLEDAESERDSMLIKSLKNVYERLQMEQEGKAQFANLLKDEGLLEWFLSCQWFRYIDVKSFFLDSNETFRTIAE